MCSVGGESAGERWGKEEEEEDEVQRQREVDDGAQLEVREGESELTAHGEGWVGDRSGEYSTGQSRGRSQASDTIAEQADPLNSRPHLRVGASPRVSTACDPSDLGLGPSHRLLARSQQQPTLGEPRCTLRSLDSDAHQTANTRHRQRPRPLRNPPTSASPASPDPPPRHRLPSPRLERTRPANEDSLARQPTPHSSPL